MSNRLPKSFRYLAAVTFLVGFATASSATRLQATDEEQPKGLKVHQEGDPVGHWSCDCTRLCFKPYCCAVGTSGEF